jgi:hypothetical protein
MLRVRSRPGLNSLNAESPLKIHSGAMRNTIFSPRCLKQSLNPVTGGCFTQPQDCRFSKARMVPGIFQKFSVTRAAAVAALLALGGGLTGCAEMGDSVSTAFADPAKYELYDCKQLETERKNLANRAAEQQGLMAKAQAGVAGPVVAELAYRNEAIAIEGQRKFAEEAWRTNKCHASPPAPAAEAPPSGAPAKGSRRAGDAQPARAAPPSRSGSSVY